jgi:hypothetical protein
MRLIVCVGLFVVAALGCDSGPRLASVSGKVTLDGKPLPKATVTFVPIGKVNEASGKTAGGVTDAEGHYELTYSDGRPGCVVAKCRIHITTATVENPDDRDGAQFLKKVRDKVPAKYSSVKTELVREVKPAGGEENFDLTSR